jgi:hypothetical protein
MMVSTDQHIQESILGLIAKSVERRDDRGQILAACRELLVAAQQGGIDLRRFKRNTWAAGVLHQIARTNFLTASDHPSPLSVASICKGLKTSQATMYKRSRELEQAAAVGPLDPRILFNPRMLNILEEVTQVLNPRPASAEVPHEVYRLFVGTLSDVAEHDQTLHFETRWLKDRVYQFTLYFRALAAPGLSVLRTIEVTDCTLHHLHACIQAAMGWEDHHLYEFQYQRQRIDDPRVEAVHGVTAADTLLSDLFVRLPRAKKLRCIHYLYDFGEEWQVELELQSIATADGKDVYPRCLAAEGNAPAEGTSGNELYHLGLAAQWNGLPTDERLAARAEAERSGGSAAALDAAEKLLAKARPDVGAISRAMCSACQRAHEWLIDRREHATILAVPHADGA